MSRVTSSMIDCQKFWLDFETSLDYQLHAIEQLSHWPLKTNDQCHEDLRVILAKGRYYTSNLMTVG
jgi:hypothetical protein